MEHCECCSTESAGKGEMQCQIPTQAGAEQASDRCPVSGYRGKRVDSVTVKALLATSLIDLQGGDYFFCADPDCRIVYFNGNGQQTFTINQVRERVYQKEPESDSVFVCYCFRHTVREIRTQRHGSGDSLIRDEIVAGIRAGKCACDLRNPQGSCCLGNVSLTLRRAGDSLA